MNCSQCGAPLDPNTPEGLCPACLLKRGFQTHTAGGVANFTPPNPEALASHFPQLEILELLGRGGMGAVYKARQRELDRMVALKILPPAADRDPAFAERFTREARALARLAHPNIVAVYDFGQTGGYFYFVMEYVDGLNLRQLLATGQVAPREALAIVPQICEALQSAHDQGIVHRDIKPENILLDKKGRVKIADFGIAKIVDGDARDMTLTGEGQMMGTPAYMAPEQIERPAEVDHRADIYSLGVVFYQMLTGELPLGRFAPPSSCAKGVRIDVRLDDVVLRALEKEPQLRYQQASEVKTQVETIASGAPVPGAKAPAKERTLGRQWINYTWQLVPVAAVLLAFFNRWGAWGWYCYAAGCAILALLSGISKPPPLPKVGRRVMQPNGIKVLKRLLIILLGLFLLLAVACVVMFVMLSPSPRDRSISSGHFTAEPGWEMVTQYEWPAISGGHGEIVTVDGRQTLKIANDTDAPLQLSLMEIEKPPVSAMHYALTGELKYEDVKGAGYLEMWSNFSLPSSGGKAARFFSRTMGAPGSGPMGQIAGTSDWRTYTVPFDQTEAKGTLTHIDFNIFLPGRGTVWITAPKLTQVEKSAAAPALDEGALEKRGVEFVELLNAGKFDEAVKWFDPTMSGAMNPQMLGETWHQLDIGGKYLGHDAPHLEQEAQYKSVFVPCRWEHNNVDIKVVFNSTGQVSGIWVMPYDGHR